MKHPLNRGMTIPFTCYFGAKTNGFHGFWLATRISIWWEYDVAMYFNISQQIIIVSNISMNLSIQKTNKEPLNFTQNLGDSGVKTPRHPRRLLTIVREHSEGARPQGKPQEFGNMGLSPESWMFHHFTINKWWFPRVLNGESMVNGYRTPNSWMVYWCLFQGKPPRKWGSFGGSPILGNPPISRQKKCDKNYTCVLVGHNWPACLLEIVEKKLLLLVFSLSWPSGSQNQTSTITFWSKRFVWANFGH